MNTGFTLFVVFGFIAVVLLLEGAYVFWSDNKSPEVRRIEQRLRAISAGGHGEADAHLMKERVMSHAPALNRLLLDLPKAQQLDRLLVQAGSRSTVAHLLTICLLLGVASLMCGLLLRWSLPSTLVLAAVLASAPLLRLVLMRQRRLKQLEAQLPDALDLIARALRAGHAFTSALSMVAEQGPEPIAVEFKTTFDEISFGISGDHALNNLAARVPVTDLRYFVMAVIIQRETGGNLAELLTNLAQLIRERFKLLGKVRALSAEGKLSAVILTGLPFCVAGAIQVLNPNYLAVLFTDTMGIKLVIGALVMMVVGIFAMWRIIDIHV